MWRLASDELLRFFSHVFIDFTFVESPTLIILLRASFKIPQVIADIS